MKDKDLDILFKDNIESLEGVPPGLLWDKENTWNEIDNNLKSGKSVKPFVIILITSLSLIITGILIFGLNLFLDKSDLSCYEGQEKSNNYEYKQHPHKGIKTSDNEESSIPTLVAQIGNSENSDSNNASDQIMLNNNDEKNRNLETETNRNISKNKIDIISNTEKQEDKELIINNNSKHSRNYNNKILENISVMPLISSNSIKEKDFQEEIVKYHIIDLQSDSIIKLRRPKYNEIYFGTNYTYNTTWIFNQNTYGRFGTYEMRYKTTYGSSYGIHLGYNRKRKYGLQLSYIFNSKQGQRYKDRIDTLGIINREVNLEYIHIPLVLKYKIPINYKWYVTYLDINAGFQYGILKSASYNIEGVTTSAKDRFKATEYSVMLGLEGNMYLNNNFFFTLGLNASLSNDINAKGWEVNDSYKKSHNFLLGANVGLSYYLGF